MDASCHTTIDTVNTGGSSPGVAAAQRDRMHTLTRRSRHLSQALSVALVPVDDSSAMGGGVGAKQPSFVRRRLMRGEGKGFGSARAGTVLQWPMVVKIMRPYTRWDCWHRLWRRVSRMIRRPHEVKWPARSSRRATGPAEAVAASGRKYVIV